MKHNPVRSGLRVCILREPKSELRSHKFRMSGKSPKTGNVLSAIESQGLRKQRVSAWSNLKPEPLPSGNVHRSLNDTSSRNVPLKSGNKRKAGKFCCNKQNRKAMGCRNPVLRENAAGQNNSNPTPLTASVENGEWELLFGIVPIIVLYNLIF
jgi:hypothetical protein